MDSYKWSNKVSTEYN